MKLPLFDIIETSQLEDLEKFIIGDNSPKISLPNEVLCWLYIFALLAFSL